jgi:hypothetical protein
LGIGGYGDGREQMLMIAMVMSEQPKDELVIDAN